MGFIGINSWIDSDNAAGFASELEREFKRSKTGGAWRTKVRSMVRKELAQTDNQFNTPGWLNVALVLEAEGEVGDTSIPLFSKLLTEHQYDRLLADLRREAPEWDRSFQPRLKELRRLVARLRRKVRA